MMDNKEFIDMVTERLNKRVKEKLEKDGTILEDEIYDIFIEEAGLKDCVIPYEYNDIFKTYAISQVSPLVFHDMIAYDPDFRRAAVKIKRRYNGMLSEYEMTFGHKDYLKTVRPLNNGYQWVYGFPNGYGASVIRSPYSYGGDQGKFELAVLKDGECCYDTEITQDVLGYLDESEVKQYLNKIKKLEV